jgi:hypothetical protein
MHSESTTATRHHHGLARQLAATALALIATTAVAADRAPPPPYLNAGTNHVLVGVAWDEATVQSMLPSGVRAVAGAPGIINIYQVDRGYGLAPYSAAYLSVDVEGYDSADGTKGRWLLGGVYGPDEKVAATLREHYGFPVRAGSSRTVNMGQWRRATGMMNGEAIITVDIKPSGKCQAGAGTINYPGQVAGGQVVVMQVPYAGNVCGAEPLAVKITAPAGDSMARLQPLKLLWSIEMRDGAFPFTRPVAMP